MFIALKQKAVTFVIVTLFALTASGIGILAQSSLVAANGANSVQIVCPTANGSGGC